MFCMETKFTVLISLPLWEPYLKNLPLRLRSLPNLPEPYLLPEPFGSFQNPKPALCCLAHCGLGVG